MPAKRKKKSPDPWQEGMTDEEWAREIVKNPKGHSKAKINEAMGILGFPGFEPQKGVASGGSIKKYAQGGGVHKTKLYDY